MSPEILVGLFEAAISSARRFALPNAWRSAFGRDAAPTMTGGAGGILMLWPLDVLDLAVARASALPIADFEALTVRRIFGAAIVVPIDRHGGVRLPVRYERVAGKAAVLTGEGRCVRLAVADGCLPNPRRYYRR